MVGVKDEETWMSFFYEEDPPPLRSTPQRAYMLREIKRDMHILSSSLDTFDLVCLNMVSAYYPLN